MIKSDKKSLKSLKRDKEKGIDFSDISETSADFWKDGEVVYPSIKVTVQIKIDEDLADWLKMLGEDSSPAINNLLRSYFIGLKKLLPR
jgi:uncharacterized protein (DUF4415 family)